MSLTDAHLTLIEMILQGGAKLVDTNPPTDTPLPLHFVDTVVSGYAAQVDFCAEQPDRRSKWLRTDTGRCVPEIYALALMKHGTLVLDGKLQEPYWTDGNCLNATMHNVSLRRAANVRNKYGVRAGTPAYMRKYYSDPKRHEANKATARERAARQREILRRAKEILEEHELRELAKSILLPDGRKGPIDDRMYERAIERAKRYAALNNCTVEEALRQIAAQDDENEKITEGNSNFDVDPPDPLLYD